MLGLKVTFQYAQEVKRYLVEHGLFDKRYRLERSGDSIIFPITREFTPPFNFEVEFLQAEGAERPPAMGLREALKSVLTIEEYDALRAAYDIVGGIAIIEIPDLLVPKERIIAEKLMEVNKTVKTVLKKVGGHEGTFRTQRMQCIGGEDTRETVVIENNVKLKVNVETAYYSVRMATERKRILQQIKPGERILCLFSGIGPYPITFSAHTLAGDIVGVEINPAAHQLATENIAKNRCTNVRLICGDAKEVIPKLATAGERFDRITMPLPHNADEFLDAAVSVSKPGTVIHFYAFLDEGAFNKSVVTVREACERNGYSLVKYDVVRVGQHAPRVWRICVDATLG
jgi:tRNA (guanine37-N1)-methyltransferase